MTASAKTPFTGRRECSGPKPVPRKPGFLIARFDGLDEAQVRAAFATFGKAVTIEQIDVEIGHMVFQVDPADEQAWIDHVGTLPGFTDCSDPSAP